MKAVQVVLDEALLRATDSALLRTNQNRSEFVRDALREHLRRLGVSEQQAADRKGYERTPQKLLESCLWENEAVWPAE
jgi:metal-responsive CopG/Arc/MetJ family transcriptional regulator